MAAAAAEIGAELAPEVASEAEGVGSKISSEAESLGSKVKSFGAKLFGRRGANVAAEEGAEAAAKEGAETAAKTASRGTFGRLMDVGTGVVIGQSLDKPDAGKKVARAATRSVAAVQRPAAGGYGGGAFPASGGIALRMALLTVLFLLAIVAVVMLLEKFPKCGAWAGVFAGVAAGAVCLMARPGRR